MKTLHWVRHSTGLQSKPSSLEARMGRLRFPRQHDLHNKILSYKRKEGKKNIHILMPNVMAETDMPTVQPDWKTPCTLRIIFSNKNYRKTLEIEA